MGIRIICADFFNLLFIFFLTGCSSIPSNTANSCSIFNERYLWYKYAKKTEQKWGTPIHIQLAIIKMESDFDWLAKPARQKIFKVIPYKRPSSSFGYSQAVKGTWEQYKKETGKSIELAVKEACAVRFRPIIMTSLSTMIAMIPLVIGNIGPGAGEGSRLAVGATILGGMIISTFFTLYVTPSMYLALAKNTKRIDVIDLELKKELSKK